MKIFTLGIFFGVLITGLIFLGFNKQEEVTSKDPKVVATKLKESRPSTQNELEEPKSDVEMKKNYQITKFKASSMSRFKNYQK